MNKQYYDSIPDNLITKQVEEFADTATECVNLYAKKNHDYGDSFNKAMEVIGEEYGVGKLYDKMNRILSITKNNNYVDETLDDTLYDMACYSIMYINYRKSTNKNKANNIDFTGENENKE